MIRKSGNRSSEKIMLKTKRSDHDPIQSNRIMIQRRVASQFAGQASASIAGRPGPTDQRVLANVVDEIFGLAAAIARGVFDLSADLRDRLALPRHFARREMPIRMTWHAAGVEVRILVTDGTAHRRQTAAVRTARDRWLVKPAFICLMWAVAGRMAIDAARMGQHLAEFGEHGGRAGLRVADCGKALRRCETI